MNFTSSEARFAYMDVDANRISSLQNEKAYKLNQKIDTLDFIRRLREGGNESQASIQERNVLRIEREIASIEKEIARELR